MPKNKPEEPKETALTLFQPSTALNKLANPELQQALAKYQVREAPGLAPQWKPEKPGEFIIGTVSSVRDQKTDFGEATIVTINTPDGQKAVFLSADLRLKLANAEPGQAYVIQFDGWMKKAENPKLLNDMKIYTVIEVMPPENQ